MAKIADMGMVKDVYHRGLNIKETPVKLRTKKLVEIT